MTFAVLGALGGAALAASPSSGTVSPDQPTVTWQGKQFEAPNIALALCPTNVGTPGCEFFVLTVQPPAEGDYKVTIKTTPTRPGSNIDFYIWKDGDRIAHGEPNAQGVASFTFDNPVAGEYEVHVFLRAGSTLDSYTGEATMTVGGGGGGQTGNVVYSFDPEAPSAAATVPLRVVLVGFGANEVDESKLISQLPVSQRPGVLIPHAENDRSSCDDGGFLFGANTLVNHGRCYVTDGTPYLVPYEYTWAPQVIHAPAEFANGLFAAMAANSSTGELGAPAYKEHLERYNATRGAFRGLDKQVSPGAPVRFVDAEKVEDWIAANARSSLGFEIGPPLGKLESGIKAGYTVFVLNTWDSPAALTQLKPQREYHLWKIVRIDPDTGNDEGVNWARVWGGRYREMIIDLGAAPNPYESETWGNRGRAVFGSESYDPPLWEFRANAPRPVVPGEVADPQRCPAVINILPTPGVTCQAVNPGATWDKASLEYMLGRFVNEAASFRFLHSYLYEPRPNTGKYYLASNIWHDFNAQTPWPSDLRKLYDEPAVLAGLRTLVPYFEFKGDTQYKDLELTDPDQGMLDQAKRDGDDVAGVPGIAMHTVTAMDYLDARPERFKRGGNCATTIPNLNVVVDKHYAWDLPVIVAGVATNRGGVPWGFLASVNDIFKWPGADEESITKATHPDVMAGTFSYTAIHELSHFLGLAHPHDTVGASKINGETVYWSGFTWTFNSTAAPTTYSHDELTYSILDQENVARGHMAYYVLWAQEALAEAGNAFVAAGKEDLSELSDRARKLRAAATNLIASSRKDFARFQFIPATFAAQKAWRHAAAYRDLALRLPGGATELQRGTKLEGAEACASAALVQG